MPATTGAIMKHPLSIEDVLGLRNFPYLCGPQFDIDPTGRFLAFCLPRSLNKASRFFLEAIGGGEGQLHILDFQSGSHRKIPLTNGLGVLSPLWSPDGSMIAVGTTDGSFIHPAVVDAESGETRVLIERNLDLPGPRHLFHWIDQRTLAFEMTLGNRPTLWLDLEKRGAVASIANWRKAWNGREATASRLTSEQPTAVWRAFENASIDVQTGECRTFASDEKLPGEMQRFAERQESDYPPRCVGKDALVPPESIKVATDRQGQQLIYLARSDEATRVLRLVDDKVTCVFETDTHMGDVLASTMQLLPFETAQGHAETLRIILPPGHRQGDRHPAVVWVYPGISVTDNLLHRQNRLNEDGMFNLHLLAARGFAVIVPAMPVDDAVRQGRELAECLADSVSPAVEAAVQAGFIHRDHVHVAGHSLGGWATLVLLAKTDIFRSGIAMAATSNLLSGGDDVRMRYAAICADDHQAMMENNFYLPGPPWQMPDRYIRNSPLFSVDKISAPVLLLHGDQDYVEIAQSEQMFSALRALGRKAELVRYWGEGHVLESPANIRHAWSTILQWLEASSCDTISPRQHSQA